MTTFGDVMHLGEELNADGVISEKDFTDYFNAVMDAFAVHIDRERIRHGLWKEYPALDQVNVMKVKVDRIVRSLEGEKTTAQVDNAIEELYDIINYANFAVRLLKGLVP